MIVILVQNVSCFSVIVGTVVFNTAGCKNARKGQPVNKCTVG